MLTLDTHPALDALREELKGIEEYVEAYSLADALREGSKHTEQLTGGFYTREEACALSAAALAVKARQQ